MLTLSVRREAEQHWAVWQTWPQICLCPSSAKRTVFYSKKLRCLLEWHPLCINRTLMCFQWVFPVFVGSWSRYDLLRGFLVVDCPVMSDPWQRHAAWGSDITVLLDGACRASAGAQLTADLRPICPQVDLVKRQFGLGSSQWPIMTNKMCADNKPSGGAHQSSMRPVSWA